MLSYIIKENNLTVFVDGKSHTITKENHPLFDSIVDAINNGDDDYVKKHINVKKSIETSDAFSTGRVSLTDDGNVLFNGSIISSSLTNKIMHCFKNNLPYKPLVKFLDNLMDNPSYQSVEELILFLDTNDLPITEDGHFLAYKSVTKDFLDRHTKTIDNSVGAVVSMQRNMVDDNRNNTCSSGLHFCSLNYLNGGFGRGDNVVILKINPRDVVSIPSDYNNSKGRCCLYEVIGIYEGNDDVLKSTNIVNDDTYRTTGKEQEKEFNDHVVNEELVHDSHETDEVKQDDESLELEEDQDQEIHQYEVMLSARGTFYDGKWYKDMTIPVKIIMPSKEEIKSPAFEVLSNRISELKDFVYNLRYNGGKSRMVKASTQPSDLYFYNKEESEYGGKGLTIVMTSELGVLSYSVQ